jgi:hypothetical protein
MLSAAHRCVLPALLALLSVGAFGGEKKIAGLVFDPVPGLGSSISGRNYVAPFSLSQDPDQYFQSVQKNTVNVSIRFERNGEILRNFPDELTLHFAYVPTHSLGFCTVAVPPFDPEKIRFKAVWRNGAQISPAEGKFVLSEKQVPGIWCEDRCVRSWIYELRINSADVPLIDQLEVTVETEGGSRIAQFTGELGEERDLQNIHSPSLDLNSLSQTTKLAKP